MPDRAGLEEACTFEEVEGNVPITFHPQRVQYLYRLGFLDRHEDLLFLGPVGIGTTTPPSHQAAGPRTTATTLPSSPTTPSGTPSA